MRSKLDESESSARLLWLEEQLSVRDGASLRLVPRWTHDGATVPPEEAVLKALDELISENARAQIAAELAGEQIKEAHSSGVEAGAVGAILALGLIASAVAIGYALWEHSRSELLAGVPVAVPVEAVDVGPQHLQRPRDRGAVHVGARVRHAPRVVGIAARGRRPRGPQRAG